MLNGVYAISKNFIYVIIYDIERILEMLDGFSEF